LAEKATTGNTTKEISAAHFKELSDEVKNNLARWMI